ncbi:ABC transporter substrate-binding protein [Guyparkeria sp. 1SP6A2]|nr:ABC transporter substrate-binding protein [Guyparkeria sp. 1SP6A2]
MDRRQFLSATGVFPLAALTGCGGEEPLLRVSGITWVGYEPLFLAQTLGLLPPDRIRLIESPSNTNSLMQLASGEVEAATLTLDECLLARAGGIPVKVVLVFDTSDGADVIMARPGIDKLAGLRGVRIGVEETAAGALMLSQTLEAAGLSREDIERVTVVGSEQIAAYRAGHVDALVSYEPYATHLAELGAVPLYDSSAFPGLIVDVLTVHERTLKEHPRGLKRLVAAYFEALGILRASPGRAHRLMAPRLGLSVEAAERAFAGVDLLGVEENHQWLDGEQARLPQSAHNVATIMRTADLIGEIPPLADLGTSRFLPEAW